MASLTYGTPPGGGFQANVPGSSGYDLTGPGMGEFDWIADLARKSALNKIQKQNLELKMMNRAYQNPGQLTAAAPSAPGQASAYYQTDPNLLKFDRARQYMDRMETPLDRYTSGNSPLGSNFRNFVGASALSGVGGGFPNDWISLYKEAAGGPSAAAVGAAGEFGIQQAAQKYMSNRFPTKPSSMA